MTKTSYYFISHVVLTFSVNDFRHYLNKITYKIMIKLDFGVILTLSLPQAII